MVELSNGGEYAISEIKNLIIVPGHACFKGDLESIPENPDQEENWILNKFQKGETNYYIEHIEAGLRLAEEDPSSLLVFSGGFTRNCCGQWSEAATYQAIANLQCRKCNKPKINLEECTVPKRTALDQRALDSYQNLAYPLQDFYRLTQRIPNKVSVVNWEFKRSRFFLHAKAIDLPISRFEYLGVNNPVDLNGALRGEERTIELFSKFPHGDEGELLKKREERDIRRINSNYPQRFNLNELLVAA